MKNLVGIKITTWTIYLAIQTHWRAWMVPANIGCAQSKIHPTGIARAPRHFSNAIEVVVKMRRSLLCNYKASFKNDFY